MQWIKIGQDKSETKSKYQLNYKSNESKQDKTSQTKQDKSETTQLRCFIISKYAGIFITNICMHI